MQLPPAAYHRPPPPSRPPPPLSSLPSFSRPLSSPVTSKAKVACNAFLPQVWQPDICRECGHPRTEHTLIQSTSPRRHHAHPPPAPAFVKATSMPGAYSGPPPLPTAAPSAVPRFNHLTYGQIPTFHLSQPNAAVTASTFDPPPSSISPRQKLTPNTDLSAFAAAVAAAAERRKTSHVPPPLPPHLQAMMSQRESSSSPPQPVGGLPVLSPRAQLPPRSSSFGAAPTPPTVGAVKRATNALSPIARLADYFLVIGRGKPLLERDATTLTSQSPEPPPLPSLFSLRFHPAVLPQQRYPKTDWAESPLSSAINLFAFPSFHSLLILPESSVTDLSRRPRFHTLVLTKVNGQKQYGSCLTFFERVSDREKDEMVEQIVEAYTALVQSKIDALRAKAAAETPPGVLPDYEQVEADEVRRRLHAQLEGHLLFQPKCLCLLSMWPFFSLFSAFLKALFRISCVSQASTASLASLQAGEHNRPSPILAFPLPIERYILNFVAEIPVPPPGLLRLRCILPDSTLVSYARPAHNRLPLCDSEYRCLFRVLEPENIVKVFACLCQEQKTLLVSSSYSLLTTVAECFTSLLFPFFWSSIYMPFVPEQMLDLLYAPVPFFSGVHTSVTESSSFFFPDDTVVVYLDRNEVVIPEEMDVVELGEKDHKKLIAHLKKYGVVSSKVLDMDINVSDWAFPHGEDLQQIRLEEEEERQPSRPETPVSSVNSTMWSLAGSPRSPSPSQSLSPSMSHVRSQSVFSPPLSLPQTPSKSTAHSAFSFASPTQSGTTTPNGFNSPSSAGSKRRGPAGPSSLLSLGSASTFSAEEIRYAFLRVFVKLMQGYRKYMPIPTTAAPASSELAEVSVMRSESQEDAHEAMEEASPNRPKREWMNVDRFVAECSAQSRPFCAEFVQTQMFARFIDDRIAVDLERKAKEQLRTEAEVAFVRSRGVPAPTPVNERRDPPASVLKVAVDNLSMSKAPAKALLMRYSAAWTDHDSAVDFLLSHGVWQKERDAVERLSWESGEKKKSLFDLDTDPTQMMTHDQIQLFDEAIVAKHNRKLRLSSPMPTPFLTDTSSHLYVPFIPASPSWVGTGEDEWFMPALNEEGGVIFPILDPARWGDRKVSDLVWMEGGDKGRRWEAKMSEKRLKIEQLKEDNERVERERRQKEKDQGSFVSRLWKKGNADPSQSPPSAEAHESVELYVSSECGLRIEGRKRQLLPRSGDRVGRGEVKSPRTLLGSKGDTPLLAMRDVTAGGTPAPPTDPQPNGGRVHQRSHSSHPILLSTGPPLSSLPVHLNPTPAPGRASGGGLRPPTKAEAQDYAAGRTGPSPQAFAVGQPSHTRTRSPSRSRSDVGELKFHPEPGSHTPPPPLPSPTSPTAVTPILALPPQPLPPALPPPPPAPVLAGLIQPSSGVAKPSPPPLPMKPTFRPSPPSGPPPPTPAPPSPAPLALVPVAGLQVPPPLPTRVPSPTRTPHPPPPLSIAFTIQPQSTPSRSRSVSRSSVSRAYHTPMGVGEAGEAGTPSPQPVSPISPGGAVGSAGLGSRGGVVPGLRTRPLPQVPVTRGRTRSNSSAVRKDSGDAKTAEEKERRDDNGGGGGVIMRAV